jgi:hypothetical protein
MHLYIIWLRILRVFSLGSHTRFCCPLLVPESKFVNIRIYGGFFGTFFSLLGSLTELRAKKFWKLLLYGICYQPYCLNVFYSFNILLKISAGKHKTNILFIKFILYFKILIKNKFFVFAEKCVQKSTFKLFQ